MIATVRKLCQGGFLAAAACLAMTAHADDHAKAPTDVTAKEAAKMLAADPADRPTVLDVRTPDEYAAGHVKDAKNIDFNGASFEAQLEKLDPKKPYLVHCRSGGRSTKALEVFKKLGFTQIYHLKGGFLDWEDSGLPVAKPEEK